MDIIKLLDCPEFIAGDNTILREILHPAKTSLSLGYSLAHARVPAGKTSFRHALKSSEVYYILEGKGEMMIDSESQAVQPGDTVYIPPQAVQCIKNTGTSDLVFLCMVDPAWKLEDEIVLEQE